jgi:hypothetical protein
VLKYRNAGANRALIHIFQMRTATRLLLIGLFASGLCFYVGIAPLAQQSGTVTVRPRVTTIQSRPTPTPLPPVPNVKLLVSPTSVEINRPVGFSAQLSRRYQNLKYRFVFGDGSDTGWQDDARATHSYRTANTFKAYVDIGVVSNGSVKQAGGSARGSINVAGPPRPVTVGVTLSGSPASVESGKSVTLTARGSARLPNAKYRFDFGDKSATGWQANPSAAHRYRVAGKYSARVELRVASTASAPQTASDSTTIEVNEPVGKTTIDLRVIPATIPLGIPILFQAVPSTASARAVYRFNFGDGSAPTQWSADPIQAHIYQAARSYAAFAEMEIPGSTPVTSGRKQVRVTSIGPVHNTNGNQDSNSGNNANSNATPRAKTNRDSNSNRKANSNGTWSVTGETNSNGNSNTAGNINANSQANVSASSLANGNSQNGTNTNINHRGNRNANANVSSTETTKSNANL